MQMTIVEALMIISSAFVLPALAVVTYSFFSGGIRKTERAKYQVVEEPDEIDYWAPEPPVPAGTAKTAKPTAVPARRREVLIHES